MASHPASPRGATVRTWYHVTVVTWYCQSLNRLVRSAMEENSKEQRKTPCVDLTSLIYPFTCPICRAAVKTACPRLHRASNPAVITPSRCVDGPSVSLPPWRTNRTFFLLVQPNLQVYPPNVLFFTIFTKDYNPLLNKITYICKITRI